MRVLFYYFYLKKEKPVYYFLQWILSICVGTHEPPHPTKKKQKKKKTIFPKQVLGGDFTGMF
jgi:hypothetical protein